MSSIGCDRCRTRFPLAAIMFGCRQCDFDLCASCFAGNSQYEAVRPNLEFEDIVSSLDLSQGQGGGSLEMLSPNAKGLLIATVAQALYDPGSVPQHLHKLASTCVEAFNREKVEGRSLLRYLLGRERTADEKAIYALSCCKVDSLMSLLVRDATAGGTEEDQRFGIRPYNLQDSIFFRHLTLEHLQWLSTKVNPAADEYQFLPR